MPAAVYTGDGAIEVQEVAVPSPGPDEVLIEVSHCGICGTDLHLVLEQYARPGSVLGHEWAGTVAALGEDVDGWELGARVVADPTPGCGECRCVRAWPPVGVPAARAARLLRVPRARSAGTRSVPAARLLRDPRRAVDAGGRAHRADRDRAAHRRTLGRDPGRPRARHRRRARSGCSRRRCCARAGRHRHHGVGAGGRCAASARSRWARPRSSRPTALPSARWAARSPDPFTIAFECSGNARAGRGGARPARLRGHARLRRDRARRGRGSTTTARSCSSSR